VFADRVKSPGDVVVLSIHWSGNWEYEVSKRHRRFAQAAIKDAGVDIIHGHSSHHTRGTVLVSHRQDFHYCFVSF